MTTCIVNTADVVVMILECAKGALPVYFVCIALRKPLIATLVAVIGLVAPNANRCVVRARDQSFDFGDYLYLIHPVGVIVQVCKQGYTTSHAGIRTARSPLHRRLHLCIVNVPHFDETIATSSEEVAAAVGLCLRRIHCHGVDSVRVLG